MNQAFQACLGHLADTGTGLGLGVFASRGISAAEVVEVAPVICIRLDYDVLTPLLRQRVFHWGRLAGHDKVHALALGYGSMYNHANPANMQFAACQEGAAISFVAVRDIQAGEELTINYNNVGGSHESEEDSWFSQTGITPYLKP